jgi:hypothetical protein
MTNRSGRGGPAASRGACLVFAACVAGFIGLFRLLGSLSPLHSWIVVAAMGVVLAAGEAWRRLRAGGKPRDPEAAVDADPGDADRPGRGGV